MTFPSELELSDLNGSNGFAINGINEDDFSGLSVSGAGDVNGDGIDDIIIGAPFAEPNGSRSGQSYVVFGDDEGFDDTVELSDLNGRNGFVINGITAYDNLGYSVSRAGDVNDDGVDDIIIGTFNADPNENLIGQSYLVFGDDDGFDDTLELFDLNGSNGLAFNGTNPSDFSGYSVSEAGDFNGDGIDDVIIGAASANLNGIRSGQSYVVFREEIDFGAEVELSNLGGSNGFAINGISAYDRSGYSVSGAGDFNGDGFDDVIIGTGASPNGTNSEQNYVVFGDDRNFSAFLELSNLDGDNGFAINGINENNPSGYSVSGAGDFNGDGFDDIIIGTRTNPNENSSTQIYLVLGDDRNFDDEFDLSDLDGSNGFAINGINRSGFSVGGAGDVNADGFDDLIIGAEAADPNGTNSGQSYVVFGHDGGFDDEFDLSDLDGSNGFAINGINENDRSGYSVSGAGDVNGDGIDDIIIGAPSDDNSNDTEGQSYVVFGISKFIGDDQDNNLVGNSQDNLIEGRGGNDTLDGAGGNDTLRGGPGNDLYIINSENDVIEGETTDGGVDTIESSVSWSLVTDSTNVENLILTSPTFSAGVGNTVDNRITGSDAKNRITGGSGDDLLDGGRREDRLSGNDGNDTLIGGTAGDELTGGSGRDRFQFNGLKDGTDTIVDFKPNADFILLSESNFGEITEAEFLTIPSLEDLNDDFSRGLIYGTNEGNLAYIDRDQNIDLTQLAILQNSPELKFENIQIV